MALDRQNVHLFFFSFVLYDPNVSLVIDKLNIRDSDVQNTVKEHENMNSVFWDS